jgi:hypothetical protein
MRKLALGLSIAVLVVCGLGVLFVERAPIDATHKCALLEKPACFK